MSDLPANIEKSLPSQLRRYARIVPAAAVLLAMGAAYHAAPSAIAAGGKLPAPPASGELGFVITQMHPPFHNGGNKTDCPDGMMGNLKDSYLRTLPKAEAARLRKPENANEFDRLWKEYGLGPNGSNICSNIYEFLDWPATPQMKGKVFWGLNLDDDTGDGSSNPYTCKHQNFTSPTGEKGIDNQIWRVHGCDHTWRGVNNDGLGDLKFGWDKNMLSGEWTQVVLLRGVDSLENDPEVEVIYANTEDRPVTDSNGKPIHDASFTVSTSGQKVEFRNVLKGRIDNGVLNTTSKRIMLVGPGTIDLDRGKLRLEFKPDGTVKGLLGGYHPVLHDLRLQRGGGRGTVQTAGIDCAGQYRSLRELADGDRDPVTGVCRRISYAYEIIGVPAFVNDVAPRRNVASN